MCATFSDDDVGKRIETADGELLGIVRMTEPDTAYVDANERATGSIRAILEWETDEDIVPIDASAVGERTGDAIRLDDERTAARDDGDEQRTMGPPSGTPDEPAASEEGRTGEGLEPSTEGMTEAGGERHPDMEDAPPDGERTVTEERGEEADR